MSSTPVESLTLAILAGGRGSRMGGVDKASLVVGGRTLLERQLATAGPLASEIIIVANDDVLAGDSRYRVIRDPDPHAGVLPALLAALDAATAPALLLLACDMPFVHRSVCELLLELLEHHDAVVPDVGGHLQPMLAAYRVESCRAAIRAALERGDRRMISFLDDVSSFTVSEAALAMVTNNVERSFFNVNTPEDLAAAQEIYAETLHAYGLRG
ncbi:MAG: molybdenum cofactor guanylyltransferase [Chloroflexi bacterium]|nr:molybdenum cofactor guanylyltransferase [Chloroflexota bacterium]